MGVAGPVPARVVLGVLSFFMFLVTYMIQAGLYLAVVSMVPQDRNSSSFDTQASPSQDVAWLLSAYYLCNWMTELPGGLLAQRYGGRRVLGVGVFSAALCTLVLPLAWRVHYWLAVTARALQGLVLGVSWPAMHALSAHWIPPTERSKFMVSYHGTAVGSAVVYPLGGLLISSLGWESVFYVTGGAALVWSLVWWGLVFDSPSDHPRISPEEKAFLGEEIGQAVTKHKTVKVPWKDILSSPSFLANVLASLGYMWGSITLTMQLPAYYSSVHRLDIKTNGLVLGVPGIFKFVFGLCFSSTIDHLLRKRRLTITTARKIAVSISELLPALLLVLLGYLVPGPVTAVLLLTATAAMGGAASSGHLANMVDLSPNYAGPLLGLVKTLSLLPGLLSPLLVTLLLDDQDTQGSWSHVFGVTSCVYVTSCTVFLLLGSGEVQSWNQREVLSVEPLEDTLRHSTPSA